MCNHIDTTGGEGLGCVTSICNEVKHLIEFLMSASLRESEFKNARSPWSLIITSANQHVDKEDHGQEWL